MGTRRPMGAEHGIRRGRQTWLERRQQEAQELGRDKQPFVLVIGGGQGGIALGARLRQLGVSHIVIDRQARPGDQWRNRYKSLCLHDPVWYDRSEEHTSELQSQSNLVCRLLLEKKKKNPRQRAT